jgi:hypothetical protein
MDHHHIKSKVSCDIVLNNYVVFGVLDLMEVDLYVSPFTNIDSQGEKLHLLAIR